MSCAPPPDCLPPDPNPAHDPALVAFFAGSGLSYEENVAQLIAQLDASAAYTRLTRSQRRAFKKAERWSSNQAPPTPPSGETAAD